MNQEQEIAESGFEEGEEIQKDSSEASGTSNFKDAMKAMDDPKQALKNEDEDGNYQAPQPPSNRKIPKDFALRVATRITAINEREMDEHIASGKVADLLHRNLAEPFMFGHMVETVRILLNDHDTQKYAAMAWVSLIWHEDEKPIYRQFLESVLKFITQGHLNNLIDPWEDPETGKSFSSYAYCIGESFIQMMRQNSDLYDVITEMLSYIIRVEMTRDLSKKSRAEEDSKKQKKGKRRKKVDTESLNPKKLYDDIIDYIAMRGAFHSDNLNQKNPNEFIIVLADRMRSTRRYVIQDIMNRYALEKKKQLEKDLREREASAEEVIQAARPFNQGLHLYWIEKRYNFKYLAVEKVRVSLQIFGFNVGIFTIGASYLELIEVGLFESLIITLMMFSFSKMFCSRYLFAPFYPKDVTSELEDDVGQFTPVLRKMSIQQMGAFLNKQAREPGNTLLLHLMPEYMKYIIAVLPDRNNMLITKDEVQEGIERLEASISRLQRGG